jgi:hypothetical protein
MWSIVVVLGLLFDILEEFMHKKGLSNKSGPWVGLVCSGFRVLLKIWSLELLPLLGGCFCNFLYPLHASQAHLCRAAGLPFWVQVLLGCQWPGIYCRCFSLPHFYSILFYSILFRQLLRLMRRLLDSKALHWWLAAYTQL